MANHKSAKKRILQNKVSRARNASVKSRVKSSIREAGEVTSAKDLSKAQSEIMKAVSKGVIHKKTAARKVSALAAKLGAKSKKK